MRRLIPALALVPALVPALLAAGCTSSGDGDRSALPVTPRESPAEQAAAAEPRCERPSQRLLDWAGVSIASHPGPVTASALVFAASTPTGAWYVLAVDRGYVHDDGTAAGGRSRSLALTNAAGAGTDDPHLIPIAADLDGGVPADWSKVDWTGERLAAGEQAAEVAIECLDRS